MALCATHPEATEDCLSTDCAASWQSLLADSITTPDHLARLFPALNHEHLEQIQQRFALRINPYYLGLIEAPDDPIGRQAIPQIGELDETGDDDPLAEEEDSAVPGIIHRYPDRVLFYVSHTCAMYCRFCTRKRKVSRGGSASVQQINIGLEYIRSHPEVRDVVVSGGDPLLLPDDTIRRILGSLRAIPHVEIIRIGTRAPVTLPQRITHALCELLQRHHPLYVNTHFNHPREITPQSARACSMLADAGVPLGNQTVLLRGVNDDPVTMTTLVQSLLRIRVRPYYIYQCDLVQGSDHFRTSVQKGLDIIQALQGHTSGLAVPTLVIDAPGGGGKVPIAPETIVSFDENEIVVRNFQGRTFRYPSHPSA